MIERITRSLAFMLRHQPEQFDLELDAYGYGDVGDVVRALNEKLGEPVREEDVTEAVEAGDRIRYEIVGGRIRALYGHSIPVEPGEASKPPEHFYVAIPEHDLDRAKRFGLRGGRRRFLHLALNEDDARESGRRGGVHYTILSVRALDAWEEGVNFYDRKSLWLAEEVPTHLLDVGETYHDGTEREQRGRGRDERSRGDQGRAGGGRGGRSRGRRRGGNDRDRDQGGDRGRGGERDRRPAAREARSDDGGRGPRRSVAPREGQTDENRESRDRRPSREPARAPSRESERPAASRPQPAKPAPAAAGGFGAGIANAEPVRERSASVSTKAPRAVEPERKSEREPERKPEPPKADVPSGPGFGAGL